MKSSPQERTQARVSASEQPEGEAFLAQTAALNESYALVSRLTKKYKVRAKDIEELLLHKEKYLCVPASLFKSSLGPLEALVQYLREKFGYSISAIARLLSRDETTIWTTYANALKKGKFGEGSLSVLVPVSIFGKRERSILESLCSYLIAEQGMSYHNIAEFLGRDDRTIWTVVNRARIKNAR